MYQNKIYCMDVGISYEIKEFLKERCGHTGSIEVHSSGLLINIGLNDQYSFAEELEFVKNKFGNRAYIRRG